MAAGDFDSVVHPYHFETETLNKKRLPNKLDNLGFNSMFLNGKLTLCHLDNSFCVCTLAEVSCCYYYHYYYYYYYYY